MQVIPVIDLRAGKAVHAVAGERRSYLAVRREGMHDGDALALATFYSARDPAAIYLADLDAIVGGAAQFHFWQGIAEVAACPLWIDFGVRGLESIKPFLDFQSHSAAKHQLILPSETLRDLGQIELIAGLVESESLILSLDRKGGEALGIGAKFDERSLLLAAQAAGIRKVLALDLAAVGLGRAGDFFERWRPLLLEFPGFDWYLGGGCSGSQDVSMAEKQGYQGVLSATAILQGTL